MRRGDKNKKTKTIAIVGLGLIGGSLAKALKASNYNVVGITRNKKTIIQALNSGVISTGYTKLSHKVLLNTDIVFLAVPLSEIVVYIKLISRYVKKKLILTDVSSTKSGICKKAKKILPSDITFVGGHPMAGTEKSGFSSSDPNLFKNKAWVLTPTDSKKESLVAINELKKIIKSAGAKAIVCVPEEHDKAVALISHFPLLVSIGLCEMVRKLKNKDLKNLAMKLASSGYRDMTRIGGGNPMLNFDLIDSNMAEIKKVFPTYLNELRKILSQVNAKSRQLVHEFESVNKWRNKLYKN